ncbi:MAG: queuosine precursor transporter [Acidimicrobiales bacterium]|nr:queuosine precursor transporter [Acidimicrobiales bacterium]
MPASLADPDAGGRATTAPPDPAPDVATTRQTATGAGEITVGAVGLAAIGVYVGVQVISQVTSLKIGTVADRAVDMGTFIYPITFTLRDVIHKAAGRRAARIAIWTSAGVNLFLAAYLSWVAAFTTDPSYPLGDEYAAVLGPLWRIVIASLLAMVVSELIDTEVYHWWVTRVTTRFQWLRVVVSNAVSVPIDNLIFAVGAFAPLFFLSQHQQDISLPWNAVWDIFWVNLAVKGLVSLASIPFIYLTKDRNLAN